MVEDSTALRKPLVREGDKLSNPGVELLLAQGGLEIVLFLKSLIPNRG